MAFALCLLGGVMQIDDTLSAPSAAAYVIAVVSCAVLPVRHTPPHRLGGTTSAQVKGVDPSGSRRFPG
ncbi:hypothetical protein ACR6C2_24325 [Streptomyces sp. INA 01156]